MSAWVPLHDFPPTPPLTIGEVVEHSIEVADSLTEGQIESLRRRQDEIVRVLKIVCDLVLTEEQERILAKTLCYKEAP